MLDISWSGLDNGGERLPAGRYRIRAFASQGGSSEAVLAFQANTIKGVELASGSRDLRLELLMSARSIYLKCGESTSRVEFPQ